MLLGHWKNIEELESSLNLAELEIIIEASRDRERRDRVFFAGLKGINLDEGVGEDAQEKVEAMKRRIEARNEGRSEESAELADFGLDVEVEE